MMKKRLFLIAIAICCLALCGAGTLAYFTARETAYNVITTGELKMDLVEMHGNEPWPEDGVEGVMPGDEVSKIVTVQNLGGVAFYTRVRLDGEIILADGSKKPLSLEHVEIEIDDDYWTLKDGFFYYYRALEPSKDKIADETEPLFEAVKLRETLGNEYQNATINLIVEAEAVQSKNNGATPGEAAGWTLKNNVIL